MNKGLLILFSPLLFIACVMNNKGGKAETKRILSIELADDSLFMINGEQIFEDSARFIPLETNEECLITKIDKLIRYKSDYYILDKAMETIFRYDQNGRYLGKLDRKGGGPEEYVSLMDFQIENDKLYALSFSRREIMIYHLPSFSYSDKIPLSDICTNFLLAKDYIYLFTGQYSNSLTNILVMDRKTKEVCTRYADYSKKQRGGLETGEFLSGYQGESYATFPSEFRISRLTPEKEDTLLYVEFEEDKLFPKELREQSNKERSDYCLKNMKWPIAEVHNMICTDKYYIFSFIYANIEHTIFYSRFENKAVYTGALWGSKKYWYLMQHVLACYDNELIQSIDAGHACFGRSKGHSVEALKDVKEDDNPVLVVYKLK